MRTYQLLCAFTALILLAGLLVGCGSTGKNNLPQQTATSKFSVEVAGSNAPVEKYAAAGETTFWRTTTLGTKATLSECWSEAKPEGATGGFVATRPDKTSFSGTMVAAQIRRGSTAVAGTLDIILDHWGDWKVEFSYTDGTTTWHQIVQITVGDDPANVTADQFRVMLWQNSADQAATTLMPQLLPGLPFQIEVAPAGQLTRSSTVYVWEVKFYDNKDNLIESRKGVRGGPASYILDVNGTVAARLKFTLNAVDYKLEYKFNVSDTEIPIMVLTPYKNGVEMSWRDGKGQFFSLVDNDITVKVMWYPAKPAGVSTKLTTSTSYYEIHYADANIKESGTRGAPTEIEEGISTVINASQPAYVTVKGEASASGFDFNGYLTVRYDDGYGFQGQ